MPKWDLLCWGGDGGGRGSSARSCTRRPSSSGCCSGRVAVGSRGQTQSWSLGDCARLLLAPVGSLCHGCAACGLDMTGQPGRCLRREATLRCEAPRRCPAGLTGRHHKLSLLTLPYIQQSSGDTTRKWWRSMHMSEFAVNSIESMGDCKWIHNSQRLHARCALVTVERSHCHQCM